MTFALLSFGLEDIVEDFVAVLSVESVCDPCLRFGALDADVVTGAGEYTDCSVRDWNCGGGDEEGQILNREVCPC